MTRQKSAYEKEAERMVMFAQYDFDLYKLAFPNHSTPVPTLEKSTNWHISTEWLDGDFALDEVLAQKVASNVVANNPEVGWLKTYLDGEMFKPSRGVSNNVLDVTVGPGNIAGNAYAAGQAAEAVRVQGKINSVAAKITAGQVQSVKINSNMTLYNANKGKGPPRLRVKVEKVPVKVFSSLLTAEDRMRIKGGRISARTKSINDMSKLAGMTSKMKFLNSIKGGGVLAFAPTMALDLYRSVSKDAYGRWHFDAQQFANDELRNQSGNLVGFGAALMVGACGTGAIIIIGGLIAGVVAQVIWNAAGMPDKIDKNRERYHEDIKEQIEAGALPYS